MNPPAPPELLNELIEDVLLRIPPDDPATLAGAALVRKQWCRVVSSPEFRLRFAQHHRTPPMLGFLCDGKTPVARFVPTSSFCPPCADLRGLRAHDARHGRVLLHSDGWGQFVLFVWNPITGERLELPPPPRYPCSWKATVLCAATGTGACKHFEVHRGPFSVVLVGTLPKKGVFTCIYSSEAGVWSQPVYTGYRGSVGLERSALVGNALCLLGGNESIIKYDLGTQKMSVMKLPSLQMGGVAPVELTTLDDGRLGFARVENFRLCIWASRDNDDDALSNWDDEDAAWELIKVIRLKKFIPPDRSWSKSNMPRLIGFAEGVGLVLLNFGNHIFTVDMKSGWMRKVYEGSSVTYAVPYINFCTPVKGTLSRTDDEPRVGAASDGQSCVGNDLLNQAPRAASNYDGPGTSASDA